MVEGHDNPFVRSRTWIEKLQVDRHVVCNIELEDVLSHFRAYGEDKEYAFLSTFAENLNSRWCFSSTSITWYGSRSPRGKHLDGSSSGGRWSLRCGHVYPRTTIRGNRADLAGGRGRSACAPLEFPDRDCMEADFLAVASWRRCFLDFTSCQTLEAARASAESGATVTEVSAEVVGGRYLLRWNPVDHQETQRGQPRHIIYRQEG